MTVQTSSKRFCAILFFTLALQGAAFQATKLHGRVRAQKVCGICRVEHLIAGEQSSRTRSHRTSALQLSGRPDAYDDDSEEEYTRKQLIKEEIEAPFRKIRFFVYTGLFAAASLGCVFTITKLLATLSGVRTADMDQLYQNLFVNVGGLPVIAYFWKRDIDSQNSLLQRIKKGGKLAGLRMKLSAPDGEELVVKLSDLRRDRGIEKRVVIVAAPKELLNESIASSLKESKNLVANDLIIAPLCIDVDPSASASDSDVTNSYTLRAPSIESISSEGTGTDTVPGGVTSLSLYPHIGLPLAVASWNSVIKSELAVALKQQPEALSKGVTIIIKKNGKVGTRRFGVPIWESLVGDVATRAASGLDVSNI
jgi:Low psii accumulation1 / Rep27